jgi:hypothetical protein
MLAKTVLTLRHADSRSRPAVCIGQKDSLQGISLASCQRTDSLPDGRNYDDFIAIGRA